MKNCSYCGRDNPDAALHCRECGTGFNAGAGVPEAKALGLNADEPARDLLARKQMLWGAFGFSGGLIVTLFSYLNAVSSPFGGTYIIAWGAIVFGVVRFIQGWKNRGIQPTNDDLGYDALAVATRLEVEGRAQEALAAYQKVVADYPASSAARDAQKSLESLQTKLTR